MEPATLDENMMNSLFGLVAVTMVKEKQESSSGVNNWCKQESLAKYILIYIYIYRHTHKGNIKKLEHS